MSVDPLYLSIARVYIGVKEIPGPKHSQVIQGWLHKLKVWWSDDETPWCGVFVAACLQQAGLPYPKDFFRARSYVNFGVHTPNTQLGAIVVLSRDGGGHVGFLTGRTRNGSHIRLLGGNQGNQVSEAWFESSRIVDCRAPLGVKLLVKAPNALIGQLSKSEA